MFVRGKAAAETPQAPQAAVLELEMQADYFITADSQTLRFFLDASIDLAGPLQLVYRFESSRDGTSARRQWRRSVRPWGSARRRPRRCASAGSGGPLP